MLGAQCCQMTYLETRPDLIFLKVQYQEDGAGEAEQQKKIRLEWPPN